MLVVLVVLCGVMIFCVLLIVALNVVLYAVLVPGVAVGDKSSMV